MTTAAPTWKASELRCSHHGVHGPDEEPGAVQRCFEETVHLRVDNSPLGRRVSDLLQQLNDDLLPQLHTQVIRETLRLAQEDGMIVEPIRMLG